MTTFRNKHDSDDNDGGGDDDGDDNNNNDDSLRVWYVLRCLSSMRSYNWLRLIIRPICYNRCIQYVVVFTFITISSTVVSLEAVLLSSFRVGTCVLNSERQD